MNHLHQPGTDENLQNILEFRERVKTGTMMDVYASQTVGYMKTVFSRDGNDVAVLCHDKDIDWKGAVYPGRDNHREALRAGVLHQGLRTEVPESWTFPDSYTLGNSWEDSLVLFRDSDQRPAVIASLDYGPDTFRFSGIGTFPLQCRLRVIQGIKGFDAAAFRAMTSLTPQEAALQALIIAGKEIWSDGWELTFDTESHSYNGVAAPWVSFLRDRYFSRQLFLGKVERYIASPAKKRVRELLEGTKGTNGTECQSTNIF